MAHLPIGSIFAGHRIVEVAGRGGMGVVYRVVKDGDDTPLALKLIAAEVAHEPGFRERFERESRLARSLDHPNIVPACETGEADGHLFITMPYVDGRDLSEMIAEQQRLDPGRALDIISQIAAALDAAHEQGLVHRDVKPANIRVITNGVGDRAFLTDFGLARDTNDEDGLTATGQFVGTLDYAAPEQLKCMPADARADVYALGCVLFHAVTGARPYDRDSDVATLFAHLNDPPPSAVELVPGVPSVFDEVIERALAKNPEDRFPSAGALAEAAEAALEATATRVPRAGATPAEADDSEPDATEPDDSEPDDSEIVTEVRHLGPRV